MNHLARKGRGQPLLPGTSLEWEMSPGLGGGRGRKEGQASGDGAGVVGSSKRWASPFRTMAILRTQALLMPLLTLPSGSRWGQVKG